MPVTFTSNYREIYDEVVVSGIDSLVEQNYDLQSILEFLDGYSPARFSYYEDYIDAGEDYGYDPVDAFLRSERADWGALADFGEIYVGKFWDPEEMAMEYANQDPHGPSWNPHYLEIDWRATADNLIGDEVWQVNEYWFRYRLGGAMKISYETRAHLIDLLANRYLDSQDIRSLEQFFYDATTESLSGYGDSELMEALEDVTSEEEYTKILTEMANES